MLPGSLNARLEKTTREMSRECPLLHDFTLDPVVAFASLLDAPPERVAGWPCSSASYRIQRLLGRGGFADCFLALKTSAWETEPERVALKVCARYGTEMSREVEVLLMLRDVPHVAPTLHEFFYVVSPTTIHLVLVMDAYDATLRTLIEGLAEHTGARPSWLRMARRVGQHLAPALAHLHALSIIHRDIKSDNVLARVHSTGPPSFVLSDLGQAKHVPAVDHAAPPESSPYAFAQLYRAPELFFGCCAYAGAPDVWAVGCTLAEVLLGGDHLFGAPAMVGKEVVRVEAGGAHAAAVGDVEGGGDGGVGFGGGIGAGGIVGGGGGGGGGIGGGDNFAPSFAPSFAHERVGCSHARQLSSSQQQLLALFDGLGTPSWPGATSPRIDTCLLPPSPTISHHLPPSPTVSHRLPPSPTSWPDILCMSPRLVHEEERRRAWMGVPPRPPSNCWKARIETALAADPDVAHERADSAVEHGRLGAAATAFLASIFVWDPAARPQAAGMRCSPFLSGPIDCLGEARGEAE